MWEGTGREPQFYDGCRFCCDHDSLLCPELGVCEGVRKALAMENVIALIVSVAVSVYLLYALLRPERF